jgi:hypothetical protein
MSLALLRHAPDFWVAQLSGSLDDVLAILQSEHAETFWSVTNTSDEVSLVSTLESHEAFSKCEGPWTLFQVAGVLDFGLTGILNSLTKPMADEGISTFAISTFNTDFILVKSEVADEAQRAWVASGFKVEASR